MRTKTLLLTAAALAAGALSSLAQSNVYSINVVGYYNVTVPAGKFAAVTAQLPPTSGDTSVNATLTNGVPDGSTLLLWNGAGFDSLVFVADPGVWADANFNVATNKLNPGSGAFFQNAGLSPATLLVVGQVPQGSFTNVIKTGFNFFSIPTTISTNIDGAAGPFPASDGDTYLHWNIPTQTYTPSYVYVEGASAWADQNFNQVFPTPNVGESFFYQHLGGNSNWVFNFTVK